MIYDPYNFFDLLISPEEGIKVSSPKIKPFSSIPKERRVWVLPKLVRNMTVKEANNALKNYHLYYQKIDYPQRRKLCEISKEPISDYVVYEHNPEKDISRTVEINLQEPNGWSAYATIGQSFESIHAEVKRSDGQLVIPRPDRLLSMIMNLKEPHERIGALSLRDNANLNRHPSLYTPDTFSNGNLFLRGERQAIVPYKDLNLFLFTIQTWFVDLTQEPFKSTFKKALEVNGSETYFRYTLEKKETRDNIHKILEY